MDWQFQNNAFVPLGHPMCMLLFFQGQGQIGREAIKSLIPLGITQTLWPSKSAEEFTLPSREFDPVGLAWGPGRCIF